MMVNGREGFLVPMINQGEKITGVFGVKNPDLSFTV